MGEWNVWFKLVRYVFFGGIVYGKIEINDNSWYKVWNYLFIIND